MKALLGTSVLIHREATVVREDIGELFFWLDRLGYQKCIHPDCLDEISRLGDPRLVRTLHIKLGSYNILRTRAPESPEIELLRREDRNANDAVDTSLLAELMAGRVDWVITEDRGIHRKARTLGIDSRVFTIDGFLEKVTAENPELADLYRSCY